MKCKESNQGCHPTGWPAGNPKYMNTKKAWDLVGGLSQKKRFGKNAWMGNRYTSRGM